MGTEHGPHNNQGRKGRASDQTLDLVLPAGVVARENQRQAEIAKLAERLAEYCSLHGFKRAAVLEALGDAFEFSSGPAYDRYLARAMGVCMQLRYDPRLPLAGFLDFVKEEVNPDILHPDHLLMWGGLRQHVVKAAGPLQLFLLPDVRRDTVRLLEAHAPPRLFHLYCVLARAIIEKEAVLQVAADRIGEMSLSILELLDTPLTEGRVAQLKELCDYEVKAGRASAIAELIEGFADVVHACSHSVAGDRGALYSDFFDEMTRSYRGQNTPLAAPVLALGAALAAKPSDEHVATLKSALLFHAHAGMNPGDVYTVSSCIRDLSDPRGIPDLMQTHRLAVEAGTVKTSVDSLQLLKELAAQSSLHALSFAANEQEAQGYMERLAHYTGTSVGKFVSARPGIQEYMRQQALYYSPLRSTYRDVLNQSRPEAPGDALSMLTAPAQRALLGWRRLSDIYLGFGALTYESRRLPSKDPALMARFGADLGKLYYINANDVNGFPGRGYAIGDLNLSRVFPADPSARNVWGEPNPYAAYKAAWPSYADVFEDLGLAQFIYTRAMIIVTVPDAEKYGLRLRGKDVQYSLVLFNSHHANPTGRVAVLVPSAAVKEVLKGTLSGYADFRGFDSAKPDLNVVLGSVDHFLQFARKFGPIVDIGRPKTVSTGIIRGEHEAWGAYLDAFDTHLADIKKWDSAFINDNHTALLSMGGYSEERNLIRRATELERQRQALLAGEDAKGDKPFWDLTHRLLDIFDLMRIVQSRWHRGYTLGDPVAPAIAEAAQDSETEIDADATIADFEPPQPADSLTHDSGEDVYLNSSALRMVHEAYAYHRLYGKDPRSQRDAFPLLAPVDALNYARNPELKAYIDTFDMVAHIDGKAIPLTEEGLTLEDELFLSQHFLPRAADKPGSIGDLRFLNRRYVGIK